MLARQRWRQRPKPVSGLHCTVSPALWTICGVKSMFGEVPWGQARETSKFGRSFAFWSSDTSQLCNCFTGNHGLCNCFTENHGLCNCCNWENFTKRGLCLQKHGRNLRNGTVGLLQGSGAIFRIFAYRPRTSTHLPHESPNPF